MGYRKRQVEEPIPSSVDSATAGEGENTARKGSKLLDAVKRVARDAAMRRVSTKR